MVCNQLEGWAKKMVPPGVTVMSTEAVVCPRLVPLSFGAGNVRQLRMQARTQFVKGGSPKRQRIGLYILRLFWIRIF